MKHRIICVLLALTFILTAFSACSGDKKTAEDEKTADDKAVTEASENRTVENIGHPLYVRAGKDCKEITASFSDTNVKTDALSVLDMNKVEDEDGDTAIYCCYADTSAWNRVKITVDGTDSHELAFNEYTEGWDISRGQDIPFVYGAGSYQDPKFDRKEFPYQDRKKDVLIWTPEDYDANSDEKYSVIYMTDGHNLFQSEMTNFGCWEVAASVEAMMNNSRHQAIIVGIENMDGWRDDELTPNLGEPTDPNYEDGHGAYFCDFVVNTVMPYVEENYNVYTDREHTAMCGSSSGGIESFYIAMEHPEKFGAVGALSPAFSLYDDPTWQKYLKEKDFSAGYPRVYIYCGEGSDLESVLLPGAQSMPDNLASIDYPADNIYSCFSEKALHNELYWRVIFPDFLKFMFV